MSNKNNDRIRANPKFRELAQKRSRTAWGLTALVLGVYYSYMLLVGMAPEWLAQPLSEGGTLSLGVPVGAFIIFFAWACTGLYVRRANSEFDRLNAEIVEEAGK
ncbi:DUF485 domain-containing protein [Crenobacter intestini]|uniref:DUF485 domain-containing protein n=1 Tax=Crenobacter intestini TaxID=2563443 RepID=A0A4T0UXN0_9NEIS|nr:DUF485 domain-containing protein [Crenobacter intestini]TIC83768.1 DUF485 domain-containing protein [Crenobacter intestini]